MAIDAKDKKFLSVAESALSAAWDRYHAASDEEKPILHPQVDMAYRNWLEIRLKLLGPETLATDGDIAAARKLKSDIDKAADSQALIVAVVKLVALLAKFA